MKSTTVPDFGHGWASTPDFDADLAGKAGAVGQDL